MKISFYQQTALETEKQHTEKSHAARVANAAANYQVTFHDRKEELWGAAATSGREKGKSLIELQQEADNTDVAIQQDYNIVMSHTMSQEDYAQMQKEGFSFENMDPDTAVTIVDKIKAELVRSGKHIAGYTDDLDMDTLAAAVGSEALAAAVAQSFREADIPLTEENLEDVVQAWNMAAELKPMEEGAEGYLIDNEMSAQIWNLYLAQNSGAGIGAAGAPRYYAEDIQGYYAQSAQVQEKEDLSAQIDKVIRQSGREVNEKTRQSAQWLLEKGYPLTAQNLDRMEELAALELPVSPRQFAEAAAAAIAEGKNPIYGELSQGNRNIYEKAVQIEAYYQSSEVWEKYGGDVTARRQLEEIRLRMTAEVNLKLLKSGFSIDTAPMEELVEALKQAEEELAGQYFPNDAQAVDKYRSFTRTNEIMEQIPQLPAQILGSFAEGRALFSLGEFHEEGKALQDTYQRARTDYEALMTAPRADLGDNIKKAFANVDDILQDLGLELTEENRRAARILGYNRMEMTIQNIEAVRSADEQVKNVVEKMTPATVLKMIRDDFNPLEKSFAELEHYFEELPEEYRESSENYARFLYGLERNHEITEEERAGYIGIFRLIRQIEKSDGAAAGTLVNAQAELHFANLITAVRTGKVKSLDKKVTDELGAVTELIRKGDSITDQIAKAFAKTAEKALTELSYSEEAEAGYQCENLESIRQAARTDGESVALLERGQVTVTAENLLAAQALTQDTKDLFAAAGKRKRLEEEQTAAEADEKMIRSLELWQKLDDKEDFREAYEKTVEEATTAAEEASFEEADTSLDVRRMQLVHKQLTVVSSLAQQEEYIVPMYIGDRLSRVHLIFDRGGAQKGTVSISVRMSGGECLEASLSVEKGTVSGILTGKTQNEVMKLQRIADTFREEAKEHWTVGELQIAATQPLSQAISTAGADDAKKADNSELYRAAKTFLHAVEQGE